MPLKSKDAERLLSLLWDAKTKSDGEEAKELDFLPEEQNALSKAISMLHCYLTDVVPTFTMSPGLVGEADSQISQFYIDCEAEVQNIEFSCTTTRDPGFNFESFHNPLSHANMIYISHIDKGTIADRVGIFKRGDVILEINKHPLARVSVERAR